MLRHSYIPTVTEYRCVTYTMETCMHTYVTPIFKKCAKTDPTNYHPISLTSAVGTYVAKSMFKSCNICVLEYSQFGFRLKHSCESYIVALGDSE